MWLSYVRSDHRVGRTICMTIDTDRLPPERFGELLRLFESWDVVRSDREPGHAGASDRTVYVITVDSDVERRRVTVEEGAIPTPLQALVRWLDNRAHR